jgi:hypothetical protein
LNDAGTITEGARSYLEKLSLNFIKVAAWGILNSGII